MTNELQKAIDVILKMRVEYARDETRGRKTVREYSSGKETPRRD